MKRCSLSLSNSQGLNQFSKFAIVGLSNFIVSFTIYHLSYKHWKLATLLFHIFGNIEEETIIVSENLTIKSFEAAFANIAGYSCGILNSFIWNKFWTFKAPSETVKQLGRFVSLNVFCLVLSSILIFIFVDTLEFPYGITWIITMGIITIMNFIGSKLWVFNKKGPQ